MPELQPTGPRRLGIAVCIAAIATLSIWFVADASASGYSPLRATAVLIGMVLIASVAAYISRPRTEANQAAQPPQQSTTGLPADARRRLAMMAVCLAVLFVLIVLPLFAGASVSSAMPLLVAGLGLGGVGFIFVWRQARTNPHALRARQPRRLPRALVSLAIFIPSLGLAGWIYEALDETTIIALPVTFVVNMAVSLFIVWVDGKIAAGGTSS